MATAFAAVIFFAHPSSGGQCIAIGLLSARPPLASGLSESRTSAVITFATLAAGAGDTLPETAIKPSPEAPTAADPVLGQGKPGAVPGMTDWVGLELIVATAGIGRR